MRSRTTTRSRTTMRSRTWIPAYRVSSVTGDPPLLAIRVFHVRDGRLQAAFPLSESGSFDTSPALLGSCDTDPGPIVDHVRLASGTVAEAMTFSSALTRWLPGSSLTPRRGQPVGNPAGSQRDRVRGMGIRGRADQRAAQ